MDYVKETLPNGLRIITVPMPSLESATVTVWVGVGSRYESKKISGISHFLEHMGFKGGKKYKTAKEVAEAIDAIGGEFNASTSKEWTNYYVRTQNEKIETAFSVISDMLLHPMLDKKEIEKERGVIIEEIGMYEDTPRSKILDYWENLIFEGNQLGVDEIGSRDTVGGVQRVDFVDYRKKHYSSGNIVITVSGGVTASQIRELVEKYFDGTPKGDRSRHSAFKFHAKSKKLSVHYKNTEQANFVLGFPGNELGRDDRYVESVLEVLLGGGMSSRLFSEIRERRGLAYTVAAMSDRFVDTGYFSVYAGVDPKNTRDAINVIKQELNKLKNKKKSDISKEEFEKTKGYIKGHFALGLESTKGVNSFFGIEEVLLGKTRDPEEVLQGIEEVSIDEVVAMADRLFDFDRMKLAIIGPFTDERQFEELL
jgi:predicted Zn-dependent peptidase